MQEFGLPSEIQVADSTLDVMHMAREEATSRNHDYIGTEHLLLALLKVEDPQIASFFHVGINSKVKEDVEFISGRGISTTSEVPKLSPRAKRSIELAVDEAQRAKQDKVQPIHLLGGLIREGESIAFGVLEARGITLKTYRERENPSKGMHEKLEQLESALANPAISEKLKAAITANIDKLILALAKIGF